MEQKLKKQKLSVIAAIEDGSSSDDENNILLNDALDEKDDAELHFKNVSTAKYQRNGIKNYCERDVPKYSNKEFLTHFRINRQLYESLSARFENNKYYSDLGVDKKIGPSEHILVFLCFAADEACSFRDIADRFDLSFPSVKRIINRVTMFISELSEETIQWPNGNQMKETAAYFETKHRFPKVIGVIGTTHIEIDPPKVNKSDYIDRKGEYSICLQGICNEKKKFIDVFIGSPGSVHHSRVFKSSFIYPRLETQCAEYYLLGGSACPLEKYLMTPYTDNGHLSPSEKFYNTKLSTCRVVIEDTFDILKQRFRQLNYCKLQDIEKLCDFIRACCVLHNLSNAEEISEMIDDSDDSDETDEEMLAGRVLRESICELLSNKQ